MKTLPDAPNMDHLRQQAKDMLLRLRSTRPGATLSEAQAAIAHQHGFHTWTALKERSTVGVRIPSTRRPVWPRPWPMRSTSERR